MPSHSQLKNLGTTTTASGNPSSCAPSVGSAIVPGSQANGGNRQQRPWLAKTSSSPIVWLRPVHHQLSIGQWVPKRQLKLYGTQLQVNYLTCISWGAGWNTIQQSLILIALLLSARLVSHHSSKHILANTCTLPVSNHQLSVFLAFIMVYCDEQSVKNGVRRIFLVLNNCLFPPYIMKQFMICVNDRQ